MVRGSPNPNTKYTCGIKISQQGEEAVRKSETSIQEGRLKDTGLVCSLLHTNALGSEGRGLVHAHGRPRQRHRVK